MFFDERFKFDEANSVLVPVPYMLDDNPDQFYEIDRMFANAISAGKNGYACVFVANESSTPVYWDNFMLSHERGAILEETHYYPFGLAMSGISSRAAGGVENKKKYQQYELNSDFDINLYESFYRSHDPQLGRFLQIDPKAGYAESPYAAMGNNPLRYSDFLGDTYVDKNGKQVDVAMNDDGTLSYTFDKSYSEKDRKKVEKDFMKKAGKVLSSLNTTKAGKKLIERMNNISTKIKIEPEKASRFKGSGDANSKVHYGKVKDDGYYDEITITPFVNRYDSKSGAEFDEWLGATMTVEVGHLEKETIAVEQDIVQKDPNVYQKTSSENFKTIYTPLMNAATRFMLQYRDEKGLRAIPYNFAPLDGYNLKYDADNQKRKEEMNQTQKN